MRRTRGILVVLLVVLAGTAIGLGAYHAGVTHGLTEAGHATRVVQVVGPGTGWFPFGFLLFPLFFFLVFGLIVRPLVWGRRWSEHRGWDHEHAPHSGRFEEWHRRQHDQASGDHPGAGGEPAQV